MPRNSDTLPETARRKALFPQRKRAFLFCSRKAEKEGKTAAFVDFRGLFRLFSVFRLTFRGKYDKLTSAATPQKI